MKVKFVRFEVFCVWCQMSQDEPDSSISENDCFEEKEAVFPNWKLNVELFQFLNIPSKLKHVFD